MFVILYEPDLDSIPESFTGHVRYWWRELMWVSWLLGEIISCRSTQLEASIDLAAELPPRIHYH